MVIGLPVKGAERILEGGKRIYEWGRGIKELGSVT
jgi:hypothetical protein